MPDKPPEIYSPARQSRNPKPKPKTNTKTIATLVGVVTATVSNALDDALDIDDKQKSG